MAIQLNTGAGEDDLLATINTTPLVDVMLVLLIIFLITVPVAAHSVPVALPHEANRPMQTKPHTIDISVDKAGAIYWNARKLADDAALQARLAAAAGAVPQPELHIWGDANAAYDGVGQVVFAAERAGIHTVSFITQPKGN